MRFLSTALLLASLLVTQAVPAGDTTPFTAASKTHVISVSTVASAAVQILPNNPNFTGCTQYQIVNTGGQNAWVEFGSSDTVTATVGTAVTPSASILVQAGTSQVVTTLQKAWVSAITATSTTGLTVSCGTGAVYGTTGVLLGTGTSSTQTTGAKVSSATNTGVDVATTSTTVRSANTSRLKLVLVNDSDTDIYVSLSGTAVANAGVRLNAMGGSYTDENYTGAVTAIHAGTGTKRLTVVEE